MTTNERILVTALRAALRWTYRNTADHVNDQTSCLKNASDWSVGYKADLAAMRAGRVLGDELSPSVTEGGKCE